MQELSALKDVVSRKQALEFLKDDVAKEKVSSHSSKGVCGGGGGREDVSEEGGGGERERERERERCEGDRECERGVGGEGGSGERGEDERGEGSRRGSLSSLLSADSPSRPGVQLPSHEPSPRRDHHQPRRIVPTKSEPFAQSANHLRHQGEAKQLRCPTMEEALKDNPGLHTGALPHNGSWRKKDELLLGEKVNIR